MKPISTYIESNPEADDVAIAVIINADPGRIPSKILTFGSLSKALTAAEIPDPRGLADRLLTAAKASERESTQEAIGELRTRGLDLGDANIRDAIMELAGDPDNDFEPADAGALASLAPPPADVTEAEVTQARGELRVRGMDASGVFDAARNAAAAVIFSGGTRAEARAAAVAVLDGWAD